MRIRSAALVLALCLPACKTTESPSEPTPTPAPTPTPVSHSGLFAGPMVANFSGGDIPVAGVATVVHTGSVIQYTTGLHATAPGVDLTIALGSAALSGDTATGANSYQSSGCGTVTVTTVSRFTGRVMNLTANLQTQTCGASRLVGDLSR
jgi:hypothetical protein